MSIFDIKNIKNITRMILLNLVFLLIAFYIFSQNFKNLGTQIETDRVTLIERKDNIEIGGYIFRNEEVIFGGTKVNYLVGNGEKVAKNQPLAQLNINSYDLSLQARIDELDNQISILERSNINLFYVKTTLEKLEKDSNDFYLSMIQNLQSGKIKNAANGRNEMLITLNKKQLMTQEITTEEFDRLIASLKDSRNQLQAQIPASSSFGERIYSERSGIFYSRVDGYENLFTAEAIKNLDFEKLREFINREPDSYIINNAMGKIAYNYDWYLVCIAPKKKDIDYIEGEYYNIIYPFSANKTIKSELVRKMESVNSDEVMLIFNTMIMPVDFDFSRKQTIKLVFNEMTGIRIPEVAVRIITDDNGIQKQGVYILRGNVVIFKELPEDEYIYQYDGYYVYLDPNNRMPEHRGTLQFHEEIIISGKDLYDGKTLD